jgi:recombination protein RecA|tara:strand:+ start:352 stop:1494 length:1143 start_codon:yes stop_codon:yes gene_type:complete
MAKAAKAAKAGKLSISRMRDIINRNAGMKVAHDLRSENPTEVKEWIPTGSRWLDSIICKGKLAGIPVGKVVEIAGLEATGKSYLAAQAAANAQRMGIDVVYFDSESAIDPTFLERAGCNLENLLYVQATSVEFVLETIEELMGSGENRMLFIWDSLALTPAISDIEGDFNPQSSMAVKARILAKGMSKLTVPIANSQSTFLVLNQLKANITRSPSEALTTPYMTPGGKAMIYAYSLRIWLTGRKAKASFVTDDKGFRIGSEVKVKLEKSRFGTQGRQCNFKILWGDEIGVQDEESWFDAIKGSKHLSSSGSWYSLQYEDGTVDKFQPSRWMTALESDKFRARVLEIMDSEVIQKFDKREGDAKDFYDIDQEVNKNDPESV